MGKRGEQVRLQVGDVLLFLAKSGKFLYVFRSQSYTYVSYTFAAFVARAGTDNGAAVCCTSQGNQAPTAFTLRDRLAQGDISQVYVRRVSHALSDSAHVAVEKYADAIEREASEAGSSSVGQMARGDIVILMAGRGHSCCRPSVERFFTSRVIGDMLKVAGMANCQDGLKYVAETDDSRLLEPMKELKIMDITGTSKPGLLQSLTRQFSTHTVPSGS